MIYRVIGIMSGSSLDGLDIAFIEFDEIKGNWNFVVHAAETIDFTDVWKDRLRRAAQLPAFDYVQLDNDFGRFIGEQINIFIDKNNLHHKVQIISSHGHTVFHSPEKYMTSQIGNGAQIAALTSINVVSDLRSLDVALGGQGAPIVPLGEKYLFKDYAYFLNIGGIANISIKNNEDNFTTFDVCVANQVLNFYANKKGKSFDEYGQIAASGNLNNALLNQLNGLNYYTTNPPKSLSNQYFGETVLSIIQSFDISVEDILRTYTEHIAMQIANVLAAIQHENYPKKLLVTGGGAFNNFLIESIKKLSDFFEIIVPEKNIVEYKEALIMAFLGIKRWREENTVVAGATGASRASIGGAVWIGQEYY